MKTITKNNNHIMRFLTAFLFSIISINSFANDEASEVEKYINDFGNQIISIASDERYSTEYKKELLINLIDDAVDANWMAKFVLARHYRTASEEQKIRFKELYRQFMINTYSPKFEGYGGETFEITQISDQGKYYIVKCLFFPKDSPEVKIDFRVRKSKDGSRYIILDIVAEGVSLIETQRSEFGSAINNSDLDTFLYDLEVRVKELKIQNGQLSANTISQQ